MLLGKYKDVTIIDDKLVCLIITVNIDDSDVTIPVYISSDPARDVEKYCNPDDLIGIKGYIDADENGLIIRATKITFLSKLKESN